MVGFFLALFLSRSLKRHPHKKKKKDVARKGSKRLINCTKCGPGLVDHRPCLPFTSSSRQRPGRELAWKEEPSAVIDQSQNWSTFSTWTVTNCNLKWGWWRLGWNIRAKCEIYRWWSTSILVVMISEPTVVPQCFRYISIFDSISGQTGPSASSVALTPICSRD